YHFYTASLRLLESRYIKDYKYDPRVRPWFQKSSENPGAQISLPYVFYTTKELGITVSQAAPNSGAIIGLDATIQTLANEIRNLAITKSTEIALVDDKGRMIAYPDVSKVFTITDDGSTRLLEVPEAGIPILTEIAKLATNDRARGTLSVGGIDWIYGVIPISFRSEGHFKVLVGIPSAELFAATREVLRQQAIFTLLLLVACLPIGWFVARLLAKPLKLLAEEVQALTRFRFDTPIKTNSVVREANDLGRAIDQMRQTIEAFLKTATTLSKATNLDRLLDVSLRDTGKTVKSPAGALYLPDDKTGILTLARKYGDDQNRWPHTLEIDVDDGVLDQVADTGKAAVGSLTTREGRVMGVPLLNRDGARSGLIALDIDHIEGGAAAETDILAFVKTLSGFAAVAIETRDLIQAQKDLMEAIIQVMASAIDAKSEYTGGHCQRVPELTKMLVEAAENAESGPFAEFELSEDDWDAVRIGAWLHDCGKVTTPEFVVDKATKLETIYDRIHEVRMRFEVLKRDAEIARLKAVRDGADPIQAQATFDETIATLDDEFAFVADCNKGGEFMADAAIDRLKAIAERTWVRTLDDRQGVSWAEGQQKERAPKQPLPVVEKLLDDKAEHVFPREDMSRFEAANPWGFKVIVPENRLNKGEVYNLAIKRGTLTDEERFIINDHICQTIVMLNQLPLPKHLRDVPEIAGGHHERMNGTGYPKRLFKDDMSVPARCMAIADCFEALTARDRPYKTPKKLSEAIKILGFMVKDEHLDPDLFAVFLRSGVYRDYAETYLTPEQMDEIDVEKVIQSVLPQAAE
ncbi:MAG: HD domain-containing phosphohydrolase, partial [Rhodospirillales bacterium]